MVFQGEVQSVSALLEASQLASESFTPGSAVGLRHTAAENARACAQLLENGEGREECWRFGVLQTLDDYYSTLTRGGVAFASQMFTDEPALTGSAEVDAAFAALAEYLASRDGWQAPDWAFQTNRCVSVPWYPSVPEVLRGDADREAPAAFRSRGIRITARSLRRS